MAKTNFDPRTYTAHQLARFATPGYLPEQQSYFAIPGDRTVVAFDTLRQLNTCRDSGDLGGRPGAVAFIGGHLWVAIDTGETVRIALSSPTVPDNRGVVLTPAERFWLQGTPRWITGSRRPELLTMINHLGQELMNHLGEIRVGDVARNVVVAPYGQAGVAVIDADERVVLDRRGSLLPAIYTVAYDDTTGRIYAFDDLGHLAILTMDPLGGLSNFRFQDTRKVMGLRVDARIVNGQLVVCAHAYKRAYFFSLVDPDAPTLVETRDYRIDPFQDPVTALKFVGSPLVFADGGDSFLDFAAWSTTAGREASEADSSRRLYTHGDMGAASFEVESPIAQILGGQGVPALSYIAAANIYNEMRYSIQRTVVATNPFPASGDTRVRFRTSYTLLGDPDCLYALTVRVRAVIEPCAYIAPALYDPTMPPVTADPALAGYDPLAARQARRVRGLRYADAVMYADTLDRHFVEVSDPHVKMFVNAHENRPTYGRLSAGSVTATNGSAVYAFSGSINPGTVRGDGAPGASFRVDGVPVGQVLSVGVGTVTTNVPWYRPTVTTSDVVWGGARNVLSFAYGGITATNGSATYNVTTSSSGMVNRELWVEGKYAGKVLSVGVGTVVTDVPWPYSTVGPVTTATWVRASAGEPEPSFFGSLNAANGSPVYTFNAAYISDRCRGSRLVMFDASGNKVDAGLVLSVDTVTGAVTTDTPWSGVGVAATFNYTWIGAWLSSEWSPGDSTLPLGVIDTLATLNVYGQSTIDTVLDYQGTAATYAVGTVTVTNGLDLVTLSGGSWPGVSTAYTLLVGSTAQTCLTTLSPTTMRLSAPWTGPSGTGQAYTLLLPINTTHPYSLLDLTYGRVENLEYMPRDDDNDFPLVIPWAPRFPLPADHPRKQFIQCDIIQSRLASNA